jgi:transposase
MQGKVLSEPKTETHPSVGIDVGKSWLDAHVLPANQHRRFANTAAGIRQLKQWLRPWPGAAVVVEATGKWHRALYRSLHAAGWQVAVVDPYRVRMFAKAHGILAKTDPLDARVLAMFAAMMDPQARPPAPEAIEALQELVRARTSALDERTALHNQRAAAQTTFLRRQLARRIARIDNDIASLEAEIARRIADDPALARRHRILLSIPGIGPVAAAALLACVPELGHASAKQIALLVGLAPIPDDSGDRQGYRCIRGGRKSVRNILYFAAMAAANCNPALKAFYQQLKARGKLSKVALIAVARKLLLLANTLLTEDRVWTPQPPNHA